MNIRALASLSGAVLSCLLLSGSAIAHGGGYIGPGDVVPPRPGGGGGGGRPVNGPTTGGPNGPSAPQPTGPMTGGPAGPGTGVPNGPNGTRPGGGGGRTGGAPAFDVDIGTWDFWWELNKQPYLRLRDVQAQDGPTTGDLEFYLGPRRNEPTANWRPSQVEIAEQVLPALRRTLQSTEQRDIVSAGMIALAKIGQDHPEFRLVDVFTPKLRRGDQELRETAALCLGIAGKAGDDELDLLTALALDGPAGRKAVEGTVDMRTRSFALYGLGLLAHEHSSLAIKRKILAALRTVLEDEELGNRNPKVAAIHGISLLNIGTDTSEANELLGDALSVLERFYRRDAGQTDQLVQAHCPTAIAKLLAKGHARSEHYKALFAAELRGENRKRNSHDLARSCALALGQLALPNVDGKGADAALSSLLASVAQEHKDQQTRSFAVLALGQIGGRHNRDLLVRMLPRAGKTIERPWCAIALGVLAREEQRAQVARGDEAVADAIVGEVLLDQLRQAREPGLIGALGVALGLCRYREAAGDMRERLLADPQKQSQTGYLAVGLGLMGDVASRECVHDLLRQSSRRPELLTQLATALGLLGDATVATTLRERLNGDTNLATLAAVSSGLALIGDRRSLVPLQQLLDDTGRPELSRAFAAVALGGICDRAPLPWFSKLATNMNYRAAVETLSNQQSGILDLL